MANPVSALARITTEGAPFYVKVEVTKQQQRLGSPAGRHEWLIGGECDAVVDVKDIAALIEARFSVNAQVQLTRTGERLVAKLMDDVRAQQLQAKARAAEADEAIERAYDLAAKLEVEKRALENDPRIKENQKKVDELQAKLDKMASRLALGSLPEGFDANVFPEAERIAEGVIQHWRETLDDPTHLVGGDFTELETLLTRAMRKLAVLVADRYKGLVDV